MCMHIRATYQRCMGVINVTPPTHTHPHSSCRRMRSTGMCSKYSKQYEPWSKPSNAQVLHYNISIDNSAIATLTS